MFSALRSPFPSNSILKAKARKIYTVYTYIYISVRVHTYRMF